MDLLFGDVGLDSAARDFVLAKVHQRATERALYCSDRSVSSEHALLVLSNEERSPTSRLLTQGTRHIAWVGHIVHRRLPLLPNARDLVAVLDEGGDDEQTRLDGMYAIARVDTSQKALLLSCDRYGMWPLYLLPSEGGLLYSTCLDLLLSASPRALTLDWAGAAQYLEFHYCLGDRTLAEEAFRLPQGHTLRFDWKDAGVTTQHYFRYEDLPSPRPADPTAAAAELASELEAAVERRMRHDLNVVCLLSGGYDSRALAAILHRCRAPFTTMTTYGDTGKLDDPDCARWLAEHLKLENAFVPLPSDYLQKHWKAKCVTSGFATPMHTWLMPMIRGINRGPSVNHDGLGGDTVLQAWESWVNRSPSDDRRTWMENIHAQHRVNHGLRRLVSQRYQGHWQSRARESFEAAITPIEGHHYAHTFFALGNRMRRAIAASPCTILSHRLCNVAPFLDYAFFERALSFEYCMKDELALYDRVLDHLVPGLHRLPSTNHKCWPEGFPRRRKPRMVTENPDALASLLLEIEKGRDLCEALWSPAWLAAAQRALEGTATARHRVMHEARAAAELSFFVRRYRVRVDLDAPTDRRPTS